MTNNHHFSAGSSAHIRAENISLTRGDRLILQHVSLTASASSKIALVGENGRGKTTLLKVLSGELTPDSGEVNRQGSFAVVDQELTVDSQRTVGELIEEAVGEAHRALQKLDEATEALAASIPGAEERYALALERAVQLDAWDAERKIDLALEGLGACTDKQRKLSTLSVGQRYRIRLALILGAPVDIVLLDEPTNHLDASALTFLTRALQQYDGGYVAISHDRAFLTDIAESFLDLDPTRDGKPRAYSGGYAGWVSARKKERARWEQEYREQIALHVELSEAADDARARLVTGWRPEKGTGKHTRATRASGVVQAFNRRLEELEAHELDVPVPPPSLNWPDYSASKGENLLSCEGLLVEGRLNFTDSLTLNGGDKLLVVGPNGAGKSTLLSVLAGEISPTEGHRSVTPGTHISLLGQEVPAWDASLTAQQVFDVHLARLGGALEASSLSDFGLLEPEGFNVPVGKLSQGQQRRLHLALCLAEKPDILLLDEPTNHLSISLVNELTQAVKECSASVVIATHDRQLLRDVAGWERADINL